MNLKQIKWISMNVTWIAILSLWFVSCSRKDDPGVGSGNTGQPGNNNNGQGGGTKQKNLFQADPAIFEEDGVFYLYGTNDENPNEGFQVYTSRDLNEWKGPLGYRNGYALSKIENYGNNGFWAPQVWKRDGKYYMAYTADEHIAISSSPAPTGPFYQSDQKKLFSGTKKQIDPFVFKDEDGKSYLFYVDISNGNKIFVTEINDDYQSVKDENGTECIRSTERWENNGQPSALVTEGPTIIKHNQYYYLLYSANHFQNPNYSVGYATSKDIKGPWKKYENNPIISRTLIKWSGTGHGDLVFDKEGKAFVDKDGNMYYVFHTHYAQDGSKTVPRKTALIKLHFITVDGGPDVLEARTESFKHVLVNE